MGRKAFTPEQIINRLREKVRMVKSKTGKNLSEINQLGTDSPYVSVIIATYNEQQNIEACLRSVKNQDYPQERIEIIVVDDESTDRTAEIAREHNVMVLIQRHSGQGTARNKGVHEASADIIAFIDADDVACSSWLKELIPLHSNEKVAAVGCTTYLLNRENDFVKLVWLEIAFRHYYSPEMTNHLVTTGCVFRKSTFEEAGGFDSTYALAEDMELCTRLANKGYTLLLIKKPLIYYRVRSNLYKHILSQVRKVAYMVMIYFKMRGVKRIASTYSGPNDYIQGLLPIACLIFLAFIPFLAGQHLLIGLCTMLLILLAVNIKFARFIYFNRSKAELSKYWPAIFVFYIILRSLSWAVGLIYGIWLVIINHARGYPSAANKELFY